MINKRVYYILFFTWSLINTLIGAIIALPLFLLKKYKMRYCGQFVFAVGKGWGGFSIGLTMVVSTDCINDEICSHEFGHSIQACLLGILFIPMIAVPSFLRYWYRELQYKVLHLEKLHSDYDDVWFEHEATFLGKKISENWK